MTSEDLQNKVNELTAKVRELEKALADERKARRDEAHEHARQLEALKDCYRR